MTKGAATRYSKDFRNRVVADAQEVLREAGPDGPQRGWMARLCREHGITGNTLVDWMRQADKDGANGLSKTSAPAPEAPVVRRAAQKRQQRPAVIEPSSLAPIQSSRETELVALPGEVHGKIRVVFVSVEGNAQTLQEALKQVALLQAK